MSKTSKDDSPHSCSGNSSNFSNGKGNCNGDITDLSVLLKLYSKLKNEKISFITADGGIPDKSLFNKKEILHINLIICEIFLGLLVLEESGSFILKVFDLFLDSTVSMLYLLSYLFETVSITKPLTSRSTNSEKYIVCKGYHKNLFTTTIKNNLIKIISKNKGILVYLDTVDILKIETIFEDIDPEFVNSIKMYNQMYTENQISNISYTLDYITAGPFEEDNNIRKKNKKKLIKEWKTLYYI